MIIRLPGNNIKEKTVSEIHLGSSIMGRSIGSQCNYHKYVQDSMLVMVANQMNHQAPGKVKRAETEKKDKLHLSNLIYALYYGFPDNFNT